MHTPPLTPLKISYLKSHYSKFDFSFLEVFLFFLIFISSIPSFAQAGFLDTSFGIDGIFISDQGEFGDQANSIVIQEDEKILIGGTSRSSFTTSDFALMRFNVDGTLDSSFGNNGTVITFIEPDSKGNDLALQDDGKIVLGGSSKWFINIARYNNDGSLDATFGTDGKVITDIEGYYNERCKSVLIQEDGKIIVGGYGQHNSNDQSYSILARYNEDGTLDSSFGNSGIVIGNKGQTKSIALQKDGKILLGGTYDFSFLLERYNSDGQLDNTFGIDGRVLTSIGNTSNSNAIAIQDNGKIITAGYTTGNSSGFDFAVARFSSEGSLDFSFGTDGKVTTSFGNSSKSNALIIQEDEKIVVGGYTKTDSNNYNFALVRYHGDGNLDNSFGVDGKVTHAIGVSLGIGNSLAIDSTEKILLCGFANNDSINNFAIARYVGNSPLETKDISLHEEKCIVYPNPFDFQTRILFNAPVENAELIIYAISGKVVRTIKNISEQEIKIDRNGLPEGIYFFKLLEKNKKGYTGRLMISSE